MKHHKYYVLGLNDEPHHLDPSDSGYAAKLAAYNKGVEDQDSDLEESQVEAVVKKLLEGPSSTQQAVSHEALQEHAIKVNSIIRKLVPSWD